MDWVRTMGGRGPARWDSVRLWEAVPWPLSPSMDRARGGYYDGGASRQRLALRDEALQGHRFFSVAPPGAAIWPPR